MKISELIKKLEKIQKEEGDLYIVNGNYDIKQEPWIYVSKPDKEDKEDTLGTFLVIESY